MTSVTVHLKDDLKLSGCFASSCSFVTDYANLNISMEDTRLVNCSWNLSNTPAEIKMFNVEMDSNSLLPVSLLSVMNNEHTTEVGYC